MCSLHRADFYCFISYKSRLRASIKQYLCPHTRHCVSCCTRGTAGCNSSLPDTRITVMDYVMDTVRTLNDLSDLRETRFGRPPPRHGLNLLWWFANYCVQIDSNGQMIAKCNPANGAFGFHRFYNWDYLLPKINLPYYEVGNLNTPDSLPDYVTKRYTGYSDSSNMDRIIVSFISKRRRFMNVYVTQHSDQVHFDQNHTYCISINLLKDIQDLSREDFLRGRTNRPEDTSINMPQSEQHSQTHTCTGWKCRCALIGCVLLVLLIAAAAVLIWWKTK